MAGSFVSFLWLLEQTQTLHLEVTKVCYLIGVVQMSKMALAGLWPLSGRSLGDGLFPGPPYCLGVGPLPPSSKTSPAHPVSLKPLLLSLSFTTREHSDRTEPSQCGVSRIIPLL